MSDTAVDVLQSSEESRSSEKGSAWLSAENEAFTLVSARPARTAEAAPIAESSPTQSLAADEVPSVRGVWKADLRFPRRLPVTVPLQEWEGVVDWVDGDEFGATLADMTRPDAHELEQDTFSMEEVRRDDEELVKPGAVFYWTIALVTSDVGQRSYASFVRFRRLPAWRTQDVREARERASELARRLNLA